ncbi:MAG: peptide-methionine (S)-S-oxide reductase MsrA [Nitrosomonas sp.]|nr:MAG: peptide-methionine (S)-S-oxide reductase MsrA [Nitrosomonas sp.]
MAEQKIIFGAGCFWGVEAEFRRIKGVSEAMCGYCGGHTENPTYEAVCSGTTGHAEVVQVEYNPDEVTLEVLLNHFWCCHDPTTQDRQGPDIGTQYRSVIFCFSPEQELVARQSMDTMQASGRWRSSIVTQILPAGKFFKAEDYHQNYFTKCRMF